MTTPGPVAPPAEQQAALEQTSPRAPSPQPGVRSTLAPRAHNQREMNALYSPRAEIYLAFRLQELQVTNIS